MTLKGEELNPHKSLIALLLFGIVVASVLTFVPYTLTLVKSAGEQVTAIASAKSPEEETPDALPVQKIAEPLFDASVWYASREEELELHGVLIETLEGRQTLAAHNADEPFNPASLLKLATSLLALRSLGPDHRFETRVYIDGQIDKQKTLQGSLYLVGNDPMFGDMAAARIARELRARGIERVRDKIYVSPKLSFNYSESPADSAEYLSRVMKLKQTGTGVAEQPAGEYLFKFVSYPLREVLLYMNAHSNNFVADRLGEHFGGPAGMEKFLEGELQQPPEQVSIVMVSGRQTSRLTARGMIAVLRALKDEVEQHGLKLEEIMPVACADYGTLRQRFAGTPLEGAVVGKTGTMTRDIDGGMATLAGIIYTERAGALLFAMLDQGGDIGKNRQLEDELLTEIASRYDVPRACLAAPRKLLPATELKVMSGE